MSAIDSILALDPASRTGWAFLDVDGSVCHGVERFDKIQAHGERVLAFGTWLRKVLDELEPALVAYEVPNIGMANRVSGNISRLLLGAFWGQIVTALHFREAAGLPLSPGEVKKHVTGSGAAGKNTVKLKVVNLGYAVETHDEADAVAVLLTARDKLPKGAY